MRINYKPIVSGLSDFTGFIPGFYVETDFTAFYPDDGSFTGNGFTHCRRLDVLNVNFDSYGIRAGVQQALQAFNGSIFHKSGQSPSGVDFQLP